jgi:hypothetical protein
MQSAVLVAGMPGLTFLRSFRKRGTVEQIGLGRGVWAALESGERAKRA